MSDQVGNPEDRFSHNKAHSRFRVLPIRYVDSARKISTYPVAHRQRRHMNDSSYWRRHCRNIVGTLALQSGNMSACSYDMMDCQRNLEQREKTLNTALL